MLAEGITQSATVKGSNQGSSGVQRPAEPVAVPVTAEISAVSAEVPVRESSTTTKEAAFVAISSNVPRDGNTSRHAVQESENFKEGSPEGKEKARQEARELEAKIKSVSNTQVQFGVEVAEGKEDNDLNFKVVDKRTGKTLREFPPESLSKVKSGVSESNGVGLLLNQAV